MILSLLSIAVGAALGAWLRWGLSIRLNPLFPSLPLGTFTANAAGGLLVGVAVAFLAARPDLSPQWRLFVVTGFLGGLTTFSTFSAEVVEHLVAGRIGWATALAFAHVATSLAMTLAGIGVVSLFRQFTQGA